MWAEAFLTEAFRYNYLTEAETSRIIASYYYHFYDMFQCDEQWEEQRKRGHSEASIEQARRKKGCIGNTSRTIPTSQGYEYVGCFCRYKLPNFGNLFNVYKTWKDYGIYPDGNCYYDQPSKLIEAFQLLDSLENERKKEEAEKQAKEQKKHKR